MYHLCFSIWKISIKVLVIICLEHDLGWGCGWSSAGRLGMVLIGLEGARGVDGFRNGRWRHWVLRPCPVGWQRWHATPLWGSLRPDLALRLNAKTDQSALPPCSALSGTFELISLSWTIVIPILCLWLTFPWLVSNLHITFVCITAVFWEWLCKWLHQRNSHSFKCVGNYCIEVITWYPLLFFHGLEGSSSKTVNCKTLKFVCNIPNIASLWCINLN